MARARIPVPEVARPDVDAALAALSIDGLRAFAQDVLRELDDRAYSRALNALMNRAARGVADWAPSAVADVEVAAALAFADAAVRIGQADPSVVDDYLRLGSSAFLRKDYAAAHRIFRALLKPIGDGDVDLGQDELVDEVLGADTRDCAAQLLVSTYMLSSPAGRAAAVRSMIDELYGIEQFQEPIREMERVAVEPLPMLDAFLRQWRALISTKLEDEPPRDLDTDEAAWLREVVLRLEGSEGLAKLARSTRLAEHLRAWCRSLVDAGEWQRALKAFQEAAETVSDDGMAPGEFLDGAALAARKLARADLPQYFERAWRAAPSMPRLRRWLGSASSKAAVQKCVPAALAACPKDAVRQRAFLHVLQADFESAAALLREAPGLGWSNREHPGNLLFGLFSGLLDMKRKPASPRMELDSHVETSIEALESTAFDVEGAGLATPEVTEVLHAAGVKSIHNDAVRGAILAAMRKAAENRLAGVTDQKRRRHYGHAADLVATCVSCDGSTESVRWLACVRETYRRFPALRAELARALQGP